MTTTTLKTGDRVTYERATMPQYDGNPPRRVVVTGYASATQDQRAKRTRILVAAWPEFVDDPNAGEWVHVDQITSVGA